MSRSSWVVAVLWGLIIALTPAPAPAAPPSPRPGADARPGTAARSSAHPRTPGSSRPPAKPRTPESSRPPAKPRAPGSPRPPAASRTPGSSRPPAKPRAPGTSHAPASPPPWAASTADPDEAGSDELSDRLDTANRAFIDAQNALAASQLRQAQARARQAELEPRYERLVEATETVTVTAFQHGGGLRGAATLLDSPDPGVFADRVSMLELVARRQAVLVHELAGVRAGLAANREALDLEVSAQQTQLAAMAAQKQAVERALAEALERESQPIADPAAGTGGEPEAGAVPATGPATSPGAGAGVPRPAAQPAPRRPDGSWPEESCSMQDPTTVGCLTPRTLHAFKQVKLAGFGHYVSCWRSPPQPYEHPKGRACDFAADEDGFGGVATGPSREYGTALATWLVRNASALGVMYVIWYHQIWTPAAGWHAYGSGKGDPSSDHTNHVHMSIY